MLQLLLFDGASSSMAKEADADDEEIDLSLLQ